MTETIQVFEADSPTQDTPLAPETHVDVIMAALMARIKPATEAPQYLKMLLYGPPGAGKTVFAASAKDVLVVDVERGTQSLLNHPETQGASVMEFRSVRQLEMLLEKIQSGEFSQFKTLVLDSYTLLQEIDLQAIAQEAYAQDSSKRIEFVPQLQDYNANTNHMKRIGSLLRDIPMHVVAIAQAKEVKDDETGRLMIRPSFTDKLNVSLNHLFSTVGYLTADSEGNRNLQVHLSPKIYAKTRIGGLSSVIVNPDINDLISANASTK